MMPKENYMIPKGTVLDRDLWIGPSIAVSCALVVVVGTKLHFLMETRGDKAPDFKGKKVMPCGYYDFKDQYLRRGAVRELYEETGIQVKEEDLHFCGISDGLHTNRGNITIRFAAIFLGKEALQDFQSKLDLRSEERGGEKGEVSKLEFMSYEDIRSSVGDFAFHHEDLAKDIWKDLEAISENRFYKDNWDKEAKERECLKTE